MPVAQNVQPCHLVIPLAPCALLVAGDRDTMKAPARRVVAGDVAWSVNGERRHSPNSQVQHATRVLAGRIAQQVPGWRGLERAFPQGHRIVRGHVVLSHDHLDLEGAADLGDDVVLRLADAAASLQRLGGRPSRPGRSTGTGWRARRCGGGAGLTGGRGPRVRRRPPKAPTGKILTRDLRAPYWADRDRSG